MRTSVLLVDIDGVLCSYNGPFDKLPDGERDYLKHAVDALNDLSDWMNADIVVTSTHRIGKTIQMMQEIFRKRGIKAKIIDFTPQLNTRGAEIEEWLLENDWVERFVIIDDVAADIKNMFSRNLVLTNRYRCLDEHDVRYVKEGKILTSRNFF